jgi:modification methylase
MPALPLDQVLVGDCVRTMAALPDASVDLVFADPPYFLRLGGGLDRPDGSAVDGVDADWDRFPDQAAYDAFTRAWLSEVRRVLKPDGTAWVIGSYHCIYRIGSILQELGFWTLNDVHWVKTNPMPNFRGTRFQNATETMLWVARSERSRPTFHYHLLKGLNDGLQMRNVWELPVCTGGERLTDGEGRKLHPTQKPEALLYRVVVAASNPGDVVLDPFLGTGTTAAVARRLHRHFIGIERDPAYVAAARRRIAAVVPVADLAALVVGSERKARQVSFARLVEEGWVAPGTRLSSPGGETTATVRADGQIVAGERTGSIHAVGAALLGRESCNGWDFWRLPDGRPLDVLRTARQEAAGRPA